MEKALFEPRHGSARRARRRPRSVHMRRHGGIYTQLQIRTNLRLIFQ
jgi:hypothetical protein